MARRALHLLAERLHDQEQDAAREMAEAQQQLGEFEAQLAHLEQYRRSYLDQALAKGVDGFYADSFHQYQVFIQKLEQASVQQGKSIEQVKKNVLLKRKQWLDLQAKRKAMEMLIAKQIKLREQQQSREEQKLLDEYALYSHLRGQVQV
ncbi:flagellar export protein FliJ [Agarivorans sp. MS3-6]|uniref:flagellar export protein FliJ n=1 Tax=Agarivorans sp. TSD2052 TaxID=2937286 RepID=UPI00200F6817|nr:flagellar export protein FliJ [Agarivorans sp. TSD2052]UPW20012.1 flagellar export protein FliJ [Agarivorans sp. TSD2052]